MIIDSLCLTYFTQHNLHQSCPCWYKSWVFILSDGGIILHCIYGPYLLYPFIRWRASWFFPQFGDCGHCCCEHWEYRWPFFSLHLYLWDKYPVVQLQGHREALFLISWGISTQFSKEAAPTFSPTVEEGSPFSISPPTHVVSCLANFGHCNWYKVVSQCDFNLNLPDG